MHGLTGGSWKRSADQTTVMEKNSPGGKPRGPNGSVTYRRPTRPRQLPTLHRMSSGSYFPPPVLAVEIPKPHGGGTRILGVPTVADRIGQTGAARRRGGQGEPIFHPDSSRHRPGR